MDASKEVSGGFFVAGCYTSKLLNDIEEPLDQITFRVEGEIAMALDLAV